MKECKYKSYEDLPLMIPVPTVAEVLGISRTKAYELARDKAFPTLKLGKRILVPKDRFLQWIEAHLEE